MFPAENIRDWLGQSVLDAGGSKVGQMQAVYLDTASDAPAFLSVQVGMVGRHRLVFVPLDGASVGPGWVKVPHDKGRIKDAPSIDTDDELPADLEAAVFAHYGLAHLVGASGERRLARG